MTEGASSGGRGALPPPPDGEEAAGRSTGPRTPAEARAAPWAERWPPPPPGAAAAAEAEEGSVLRLLAVPWAGAGASAYAGWAAHLGPEVELWAVRPPGREGRTEAEAEEAGADLRALAAAAAAALAPLPAEKPYALFGHGTGAWVAFALLRALVATGAPPPLAFFASNFPSPFVDRAEFLPDLPAALGDRRAAAAALRPFGLPATLFEPTLWETFGGAVRREYGLLEGLEPPGDDGDDAAAGGGKIPCRFRAFLSQDDPVVGPKAGQPELMEGWGWLSTHKHMAVDVFQGDHFYLCDPDVGEAVAKAVGGYCQALADELTFEL